MGRFVYCQVKKDSAALWEKVSHVSLQTVIKGCDPLNSGSPAGTQAPCTCRSGMPPLHPCEIGGGVREAATQVDMLMLLIVPQVITSFLCDPGVLGLRQDLYKKLFTCKESNISDLSQFLTVLEFLKVSSDLPKLVPLTDRRPMIFLFLFFIIF